MNIESPSFRSGATQEAAYQAGVLQGFGLWRRAHVASFRSIPAAARWLSFNLRMPTSYNRGRAYILFGCHANDEKFGDAHGQSFSVADLKAVFNCALRKSMFTDALIIWQRCRVNRIAAITGETVSAVSTLPVREACKLARKQETRSDWYDWVLRASLHALKKVDLSPASAPSGSTLSYHFEIAPYGEPTSREKRSDGSLDYQGLAAIFMAALITRNLSSNNLAPVMRQIISQLHIREYGTDDVTFCYELSY